MAKIVNCRFCKKSFVFIFGAWEWEWEGMGITFMGKYGNGSKYSVGMGMGMGMGMNSWEWEGMGKEKAIPAHLYFIHALLSRAYLCECVSWAFLCDRVSEFLRRIICLVNGCRLLNAPN